MNKGTPKTLNEAIMNGLGDDAGDNHEFYSVTIEAYVLDFLRQRFGAAYLEADARKEPYGPEILEALKKLAKRVGVE